MAYQFKNLTLEVFPHCNANCDFCYQKNYSNYQEKTAKGISLKVIPVKNQLPSKEEFLDACEKSIKDNHLDTTRVEIWGGEIFYDNSPKYTKRFIEFLRFLNPDSLTVDSNLLGKISENTLFHYIVHAFKNKHLEFYTSFDPIGRFKNEKMINRFRANLNYVHKFIPKTEIQMVLTDMVLKGKYDKHFLKMFYNDPQNILNCYIDHRGLKSDYVKKNFPRLMVEFFREFPNARNIDIIKNKEVDDLGFFDQCYQKKSAFLSYSNNFRFDFDRSCFSDNSPLSKEEKAQKMIKAYGCDSCKYRPRCVDNCPSVLEHAGLFEKGITCYKKALYEEFTDF